MPRICIEITEQQEARIAACIRDQRAFRIDGGEISFDKESATLKAMTFEFVLPTKEATNER